jgi:3'-5' exoribonuclease
MTTKTEPKRRSHQWIKDISEEDKIAGCYVAKRKSLGTTRGAKPFLTLILADRTGEIEAKVWEEAEYRSCLFQEGDIVEVVGHAGSYRGQTQITVTGLSVPDDEADPGIFLESSPLDPSEMMKSLKKILKEVKNSHLKAVNETFLSDRRFVGLLKQAPSAKQFHHSYLGGLLEHTVTVCRMAGLVAKQYPRLDGDLLLTAAFLHDIGKIREFKFDFTIDYTDEGRLLGHLILGISMLEEKLAQLTDFPPDLAVRLKHLILSHHGQYEFGSPKRPKFLEAFALHLIDDLDAKINGLGRFMERDRQEGSWTEFNRLFDRYLLKRTIPPKETEADIEEETSERQQMLFP